MMREQHHHWRWRLAGTPAQLWPLVADTDRFDRDTGVPPVERLATPDALLAQGRVRARVRRLGIALDYEQLPFEWEAPHSFRVTRRFERGPLDELRIAVGLEADGDAHTIVDYQVWSRPSGLLGAVAIPLQVGVLLARSFERTMRTYADVVQVADRSAATSSPPVLGDAARRRLDGAAAHLRAEGGRAELVDSLCRLITDADDVAVARLRPHALADQWGDDRGEVLDMFLEATRAGIVRFRWDVLCPRCRVAKSSVTSLALMSETVHCDTCLIDYTADLAASVEMTFRPTDQIRAVEPVEHCIGGPMTTPHVVVQLVLQPMGRVELGVPLEPGRYRVRVDGEHVGDLEVRPPHDGEVLDTTVSLRVSGSGIDVTTLPAGSAPTLVSEASSDLLVVIERPGWAADAVTGAAVLARQRFRDLFADEALRPGEQLDVGTVTIAFTDLCGSTAMYCAIGDAVAFGRVQAHFDVLRRCVVDNGGAVVKTIGDAVMAVFPDPVAGVRAMQAAQVGLRSLDGPGGALHLKAAVHAGPAIAVTLNGRIDYFGTTVNLAARLQGLAAPDELVLSDAIVDEDVAALVGATVGRPDEVIADLRGLEGVPIAVHRVVVGAPSTERGLAPSGGHGE